MSALAIPVPTATDMRSLGTIVGRVCVGGDVLVLAGDLGAGKTTFTQGLAQGLGIDEAVTSPTFVIARAHVNPTGGPDLVHVDAYRLGGAVELDDLDLDTELATSVVVVEWGTGLAERLSAAHLDVTISRSDDEDDDHRVVTFTSNDDTWATRLAGISARWPT